MATWSDTPLTRCATASLPHLIRAHDLLHGLAAPQAARLSERIAAALADLIDIAGDVECYGNKWYGGEIGEIAHALRVATAEYMAG
jgi:hypothetical protein